MSNNNNTTNQPKKKGIKIDVRCLGLFWRLSLSLFPAFALILIVGMLPTIIAWITDEYPEKYTAYTVGAFNLCGIMPYFFSLWSKGHTVRDAAMILQDVNVWMIMYGAAALGWFFYYAAPMFASMYIAVRDDRLIEKIKREQERLVKEWGEDVKGEQPKEKEAPTKKK